MSEPQSSDLRVGDAEREEALRALGDHMSAGRLDIDEYGDRTARVATSKTRGDLLVLFMDLPEPKPRFGPVVTVTSPPPPVQSRPAPEPLVGRPGVERWQQRPLGQRVYGALVPVSFLAALFLFFTTHVWFVFLLPVAFTIIGGSLFGDSWSHDRRAWERDRNRRRRRHY
ncbi:DUF1707 domain-containing protein [Kibdelosporangium lantanae]